MAIVPGTRRREAPAPTLGELPPGRFLELARAKDADVRAEIAGRADAPLGVLLDLAQDPKAWVRAAVAANPVIGEAHTVAAMLASDRSDDVAWALVENPAVSREVLATLADTGPRPVRGAARDRLENA